MSIKHYTKTWSNFETQSLAFAKLRANLPYPKYLVRGYEGVIAVYQPTDDPANPTELLKIYVKASASKDESGFYHKKDNEYLLVGGDFAWKAADLVAPLLPN